MRDQIQNEYFEWMHDLVCNDKYYKKLSYRKLLYLLHNTEFTWIVDRDSNRADDGINFRYRFGYEVGYPDDVIREHLDIQPCSLLEMMVALAFNIEEQIMDDPKYGNRTGQWFWNMVVNLDLGAMSDDKFDRNYAEHVIFRLLNRTYKRNGEGGLFTVKDRSSNMITAEIWYQAMWYLNDFLEE